MNLDIVLFSKEFIVEIDSQRIFKSFIDLFPNQKISISIRAKEEFKENFNELNIFLREIEVTKDGIHDLFKKIIYLFEMIYVKMEHLDFDVIIANDDVAIFDDKYQNDWNDFDDCGIFITQRNVKMKNLYYKSNILKFQLNTKYCSFDVFFDSKYAF